MSISQTFVNLNGVACLNGENSTNNQKNCFKSETQLDITSVMRNKWTISVLYL